MEPSAIEVLTCARVPCAPGARLDFSWGPGTEVRLCEVANPAGQGGEDPYKSTVIWSAPSASHRALAHAVAPLQANLCQGAASGNGVPSTELLAAFCQDVRQRLKEERDSADEAAGNGGDVVALEAAIWGLLELLYVGAPRSEAFIAEDLAAWLAEHSGSLDGLAGVARPLSGRLAELLASARPDVLEDYWPCLTHLVAVGRVSDALALLGAHDAMVHSAAVMALGSGAGASSASMAQYELLDALYVVLRQMPHFRRAYAMGQEGSAAGGSGREFDNMAEFLAYRSAWQSQCASLPTSCAELFSSAAAASPRTVEGVKGVLAVLTGDEGAVTGRTSHWVEYAVAQAVHLRPNLQAQAHLRGLLQAAAAGRPFDAGTQYVLSLLYNLLLAVAEGEPQGVVEVLAGTGAVSPWFMAHVYELLRAPTRGTVGARGLRGGGASALDRPLPLSGGDQAEYWRLLFAETLMPGGVAGGSGTWALALAYLAWCPVHGADAAEVLLEGLPVGSRGGDERLLRKALAAASAHGLAAPAASLCRTAGAAAYAAGRLGAAAQWLAGSGGTRDVLRAAVALEPLAARAEGVLATSGGSYTAATLPVLVDTDVEPLLDALSPALPEQQLAAAAGLSADTAHSLWLLKGLLQLQQSVKQLLAATQPAASPSDVQPAAAARAAAVGVRDAVMELLGGSQAAGAVVGSPQLPRHLVGPLLAYVLPLLEGTGQAAMGGAFSSADVSHLISALAASAHLQQPARGLLDERHVKDVRLALARALARAHAYESSPANGLDSASATMPVTGPQLLSFAS